MNGAPFSAFEVRLRLDRGLLSRLKQAGKALARLPREKMTPGEAALSDNGQFLAEEAEALRRRIRTLPPLPAGNGIPAVLALARRIVREGENRPTAALILRLTRESGARELRQAVSTGPSERQGAFACPDGAKALLFCVFF